MCDSYPPTLLAAVHLEDFETLENGNNSYKNSTYYNNKCDIYSETEMKAIPNVHYDFVSSREYRQEDWKSKVVIDWRDDDTVSWLIEFIVSKGVWEYDVPYYNFKISGIQLKNMRQEEVVQRMRHPNVDPNLSRKIGETIFKELRARLNEEIHRQTSVFRYAESPYTHQETVQSVFDLDKHRLYTSDYEPNNISLLPASDSRDDTEDTSGTSASAPSIFWNRSDSKIDHEEEKKKITKRSPGRPKGSGKSKIKRPRNAYVPEFLWNLLSDGKNRDILDWEDYPQFKFRFIKPDEVAKLWGQMKQNDNMTFEKFSRAMRYHYRQKVLVSVPTARLVYQFGSKGPDFKTQNPNFVKVKSEADIQDMSYS